MPIELRLAAVQRYVNTLQYNHTGMVFFDINKKRPLKALMEVGGCVCVCGCVDDCLSARLYGSLCDTICACVM